MVLLGVLSGRVAIVAAASRGLGKAVAQALVTEGANVVIFSRDGMGIRAAAEEIRGAAAEGGQVLPLSGDVTKPADTQRVLRTTLHRFGDVDILCNNAGGPPPGMFDQLTDADWERALQLNLMSAVRLTSACLPSMQRRGWGRVITITSSAVKQPLETLMLSNSVRLATTGWSKTLADQVARDGITVNTLAPGTINTENARDIDTDAARRQGRDVADLRAEKQAAIPVGRYGEPKEIGATAAFLASEQAAYITGVTLLVDGGRYRGLY